MSQCDGETPCVSLAPQVALSGACGTRLLLWGLSARRGAGVLTHLFGLRFCKPRLWSRWSGWRLPPAASSCCTAGVSVVRLTAGRLLARCERTHDEHPWTRTRSRSWTDAFKLLRDIAIGPINSLIKFEMFVLMTGPATLLADVICTVQCFLVAFGISERVAAKCSARCVRGGGGGGRPRPVQGSPNLCLACAVRRKCTFADLTLPAVRLPCLPAVV